MVPSSFASMAAFLAAAAPPFPPSLGTEMNLDGRGAFKRARCLAMSSLTSLPARPRRTPALSVRAVLVMVLVPVVVVVVVVGVVGMKAGGPVLEL